MFCVWCASLVSVLFFYLYMFRSIFSFTPLAIRDYLMLVANFPLAVDDSIWLTAAMFCACVRACVRVRRAVALYCQPFNCPLLRIILIAFHLIFHKLHYCRSYFLNRSRNRRRIIFIHFYVRRIRTTPVNIGLDVANGTVLSLDDQWSLKQTFIFFGQTIVLLDYNRCRCVINTTVQCSIKIFTLLNFSTDWQLQKYTI